MKKALLLSVLFTASLFALPSVYYISPTGTGTGASISDPTDFATAEAALAEGDVIYFLPGTYSFPSSTDHLNENVENVSLIGLAGAENTFIDGAGTSIKWGVIRDGWYLEGLTFQNFAFSLGWGGTNTTLHVIGTDDPAKEIRITECVFRNSGNITIWSDSPAHLKIDNCQIYDNGDITSEAYVGFLINIYRRVKLINNTFYNNHVRTPANDLSVVTLYNFGLASDRSDLEAYNNIFMLNTSDRNEPIVQMRVDDPVADTCVLTFGDNLFYDNYWTGANEGDVADDEPNDSLGIIVNGADPVTQAIRNEVGDPKIVADPLFADAASGDFSLDLASPAIGEAMEVAEVMIPLGSDIGAHTPVNRQLYLTFEEGSDPLMDFSSNRLSPTAHNDGITYETDDPAAGTYSAGFTNDPSDPLAPSYITAECGQFDATGDFTFSGWFKFEEEIEQYSRFVLLAKDTEDPGSMYHQQAFYIRTNNVDGSLRAEYESGGAGVALDTRDGVIRVGEWRQLIYKKSGDLATFEVKDIHGNTIQKVYNNTDVSGNPMDDGSVNKLYLGWALNYAPSDPREFAGQMDNIELYNHAFIAESDTIVPPTVTSSVKLAGVEGDELTYVATVEHQNGTPTTISFVDLPTWLTQDGDTVSGTAAVSGTGVEKGVFKVVADDGAMTDTLYVDWTVTPETLYVSPTGTETGSGADTDPMDLATAFNSTAPGGTVMLLPGTYNITAEQLTSEAQHAEVTLTSSEGANTTILDGGSATKKLMWVRSGMTIDGLTFRNFGPGDDWYGGNILMFATDFDSTKQATITNCIFQANTTRQIYGYNGTTAKVLVYNNVFKNNEERIIASVFRELKFYNNTVFGNNGGAEVMPVWSYANDEARMDLKNNIFSDNTAANTIALLVSEEAGSHSIALGTANMFSDNSIGGAVVDFNAKNGTQDVDTTSPFAIMADPMFEDETTGDLNLATG
ncbi:MAG: hypothetical protein GF419_12545, partial [Ignavibacteriales bacterium]|nr:hypothetical protein [Ignavibacteriales bacterium]